MTAGGTPWQVHADGLVIRVRATPKADRDALDGVTDVPGGKALKVRVRAAPEDGAANAAIEKVLAAALGVAGRAVEVTAGDHARLKTVRVAGDATKLAAVLEGLVGKSG